MKKTNKNAIKISVIALLTAFSIVVSVLCTTVFDAPLRRLVGEVSLAGETEDNGPVYLYNTTEYDKKTLLSAKEAMSLEIAEEGIVLLKHEGNTMPYPAGTTFSFFGKGSANWKNAGDLKSAFEAAGYSVNSTLWDFYTSGAGKSYRLGPGSINYGDSMDYSINECPLSELRSNGVLDSAQGTVPVFVINRNCGEGVDPARGMYSSTDNVDDWDKTYQELNSEELEIVRYLAENYSDVVILVNSGNPVELGWADELESVHNIIQCPPTGSLAVNAIPLVMKGEINPSGHLTDTYAYDLLSAPATENCGDMMYYSNGQATDYYYVAYEEGIYVGYRYYETRYEDAVLGQGNAGEYDYASTVQYPFGYGLSYTSFQWSDFECVYDAKHECFNISVTVTNTGNMDGKEVVQIYAQSPYTDYDRQNGIEKAAVTLVGFAKTDVLTKNGGQETVTISVPRELLKSYDSQAAKTYIIEAGDYYMTAADNAHTAVNNILVAKGVSEGLTGSVLEGMTRQFTASDMDVDTDTNGVNATLYANDTTTGTAITNQFDFATLSDIVYLSRNDWEGTYPKPYGEVSSVLSEWGNAVNGTDASGRPVAYTWMKEVPADVLEQIKKIGKEASLNPDTSSYDSFTFSAGNGTQLIDLRGVDFDDAAWDTLLDNLSADDITLLLTQSGYGSSVVNSIEKPAGNDRDAATGLVISDAMANMPSIVLLAQSFNPDIAYRYGKLVGEDALQGGKVTGWYAPAMNIHRTSFTARVNEYYSEDPFLSGVMAAKTTVGANEMGLYTFIKHFALNDQDLHRGDRAGENGLSTWANEQAIREIYLVPFEACIKQDAINQYLYVQDENGEFRQESYEMPACTAVMTSFNRIGATWAGGCYNLITGVLMNEWGFHGFVITDFDNGGYMDTEQMIYAGGNGKLCTLNASNYSLNTSDNMEVHYAREAVKGILYTMTNSAAMNGYLHGTVATSDFPIYGFILIGLWLVCVIVDAVLVVSIVKKNKGEGQSK